MRELLSFGSTEKCRWHRRKAGYFWKEHFFELEAHKVPLGPRENVRDEELEERPAATAVLFLVTHQTEVLRECGSRGVEGQVKAEEGDMTAHFVRVAGAAARQLPPHWKAHPAFALRGTHSAPFSPCASRGADTSPRLPQ